MPLFEQAGDPPWRAKPLDGGAAVAGPVSIVAGFDMRVLLLAENWPPRVGGIENYLKSIVEHLPAEITIVAPNISGPSDVRRKKQILKSVIRKRFFWPLIKPAWLPLYLWLRRKVKKEKYDVVLCGKTLFEGLAGYYLKRRLGVPYIVFTYAMEIEVWSGSYRGRQKLIRVLQNADRVVYINEETKKTLFSLGVVEKQLVKIWPGVDDRFFADISLSKVDATRRKYNLKSPYILTVSRLIERKGVDVLIEAFSGLDQTRFSNIDLVVVGDGPMKGRLEHLAEKLWVNTSVNFLGWVPDMDLPALYKGATVFTMTPRRVGDDMEGFGIVYLEAAAGGVPAVGTDTGGVAEAVVHNKTGLVVKPDSLVAVKDALEKLLAHKGFRHKLGKQARQRAWHQFRWRKRILLVKGMLDAVASE